MIGIYTGEITPAANHATEIFHKFGTLLLIALLKSLSYLLNYRRFREDVNGLYATKMHKRESEVSGS